MTLNTAVGGTITALGTGTGGAGTYTIDLPQTVANATYIHLKAVTDTRCSINFTEGAVSAVPPVTVGTATFTASIATSTLTVTALTFGGGNGRLSVGMLIYPNAASTTMAAPMRITALGTGTGGNGTYTLSSSATCLLYTSPSPRDVEESRMPSSA